MGFGGGAGGVGGADGELIRKNTFKQKHAWSLAGFDSRQIRPRLPADGQARFSHQPSQARPDFQMLSPAPHPLPDDLRPLGKGPPSFALQSCKMRPQAKAKKDCPSSEAIKILCSRQLCHPPMPIAHRQMIIYQPRRLHECIADGGAAKLEPFGF